MQPPKFISYKDFAKEELLDRFTTYEKLEVPLPSKKSFYDDYFKMNGFSEWLEAIEGVSLTENQAFSIASTYVNVGQRKISDLVSIFVSLEKHQNITLPVKHMILTTEYWEKRLLA